MRPALLSDNETFTERAVRGEERRTPRIAPRGLSSMIDASLRFAASKDWLQLQDSNLRPGG
jgi:hypothetical protein